MGPGSLQSGRAQNLRRKLNHTRCTLPRERSAATDKVEPPEVIAEQKQIHFALAIGQLVYDRRTALDLTQASLAGRLGMTVDEVEAIELGALVPRTEDLWHRLLLGILPELFLWARFLPESDLQTFAAEAVDTIGPPTPEAPAHLWPSCTV